MLISYWCSDVCLSDLAPFPDAFVGTAERQRVALFALPQRRLDAFGLGDVGVDHDAAAVRQAAVAALQNGAVGTHALGAAMQVVEPRLGASLDLLLDRCVAVLAPLGVFPPQIPEVGAAVPTP